MNGLLIQKPDSPPPTVGAKLPLKWQQRTSANGKTWIKVNNATLEDGQLCRILRSTKTDYSDSYGNVSFNLEFEPVVGGGGDGRRVASAPSQATQIDPAERSHRIERQHSQEMALRYFALQSPLAELPDTKKLREMISWFQRDIGHSPERENKTAEPEPEPEPDHAPSEEQEGYDREDEF